MRKLPRHACLVHSIVAQVTDLAVTFVGKPQNLTPVSVLKSKEMYAGQLKTGPVSLTKQNKLAIQKDAELVKRKWHVEHILEQGASTPYLKALDDAGIKYHIGPQIP